MDKWLLTASIKNHKPSRNMQSDTTTLKDSYQTDETLHGTVINRNVSWVSRAGEKCPQHSTPSKELQSSCDRKCYSNVQAPMCPEEHSGFWEGWFMLWVVDVSDTAAALCDASGLSLRLLCLGEEFRKLTKGRKIQTISNMDERSLVI